MESALAAPQAVKFVQMSPVAHSAVMDIFLHLLFADLVLRDAVLVLSVPAMSAQVALQATI
mgnify:CR=1 FL=1